MAKLSKLAAKRKATRDKKAAMTPDRKAKKAENQRLRRAAKKRGKFLGDYYPLAKTALSRCRPA